jgi:hypothetical protein
MTETSPSKEDNRKFVITDLTLSAFLILKGHKADMIRKGETGRGHPIGGWSFDSTPELKNLVMEYNQGKTEVEPRDFHNALSNTRSKLLDFLGVRKKG